MWTGTAKKTALDHLGRWSVDLFSGGDSRKAHASELPYVSLGELFRESKSTRDPQNTPNELFTYIGMENVESNTGSLTGNLTRIGREIKSRSKVVSAGQILYGRLRPNLNKVCLFDGAQQNVICSTEFFVLNVESDKVYPLVLREILSSRIVLDEALRFISGAALPRISFSDLASIKVPLPSMTEQAELEAFISKMQAERETLRKQLSLIPSVVEDRLKQSLGIARFYASDL